MRIERTWHANGDAGGSEQGRCFVAGIGRANGTRAEAAIDARTAMPFGPEKEIGRRHDDPEACGAA